MVYLDLTANIDRKILDRKLEAFSKSTMKFVGDDPRDTPMRFSPACITPWAGVGGLQAGDE